MQVEASAQKGPESSFYLPNIGYRLMNRPAIEKLVIKPTTLTSWKSVLVGLSVFVASVSALAPPLVAQTGNVVISTNTTWATGTYSLTSLSVENGATLTIGGGSTVTASGAVLVTANSAIVLQSINNATQVNGSWQGSGVTVNAGSVQVDAGSSINADGEGYLASSGPGGAPTGSSAGGSYGGMGGSGDGPTPAASIYGSSTMPSDLGSGGGSRCCGAIAGTGGGAIRLIVSGTLTDNGVISANGANLVGYQGGGGSGGSLWVTTSGLVGSGVFTANGGTGGEAAGGGGRIAVYYNAPTSSFTGFSTSTSTGGSCQTQCSNGTASAGGTGTAAFFDTSATNTNLMVDQDLTVPAGTTVTYNSITVQPGAVLTIGGGSKITVTNALTVSGTLVAQSSNNSAQVNGSWQGSGVTFHAASVVVNTAGSINADNQGYIAGAGPGGAPAGSSAGGSYGGLGGVGDGVSPGGIYGSTTAPTDLGSGGNTRCCGTIPGAGGGALTITVSGTLTDNGIISANGGDGTGLQVGGGSGGTVSIQTATLTGSGSIAVNGGLGGEAGGGGGRVAIYYNTNNGFNIAQVTSNGGTSSSGNPGAVGTVFTLGAGSNLTVSNDTVLPPNANLSFNSVTVNNGATLTLGSGTTLGSNSVTVTGGADMSVGGGSTLNVSGAVLVTGNSRTVLQSTNNSSQVNGSWQGVGVTVNAASVQVDAGSSINADAQGYLASAGPGGAPAGSSAGGSYGGMGGQGDGSVSAGPIYGSDTMPTDLGSGGGSRCCGAIAGVGGGAVRLIVTGTLTDNGVISANGGNLVGYQGGGGSGGSVWVTTAALVGSGVFTANAGTGGEAAGGGGRVAVYYNAPTSTFTGFSTSTANGASCGTQCSNGALSAGGVGTAAFFDTSASNTNLMVDQDLTIPAGTTVSYNSITVQPDAVLTIGGGSTVTVAGSLTVSGTVVAQSIKNTALLNGTWQGAGVTLNAASVVVNTNGSINADGQGYVPGAGPGGAPAGSSAGGSYGGAGGAGDGTASLPIYGSATLPVDLGSGGGLRCCSTSAGAGGGALFFNISGTLTNNGIISANGAAIVGYQAGGGSGGTVYVKTVGLSGSGAFTANGGLGGEAGGGGGRVAVYYDAPSSNFTGFSASTASGAGCGTQCTSATLSPGSNGTSAFFDTSATNNNVAVYQNFTIPAGASPIYNSVTVQAGALTTIGGAATLTVTNALTVSGTVVAQSANNTAQVNDVWVGSGVAINAGSITVNSAGSLNADTQGYVANAGPGGAPAGTSAGASYGGLGGVGNGSAPSLTYGSKMLPVDLGSGGGSRCCGTIPGSGGGDLLLTVAGALTDNGVISANGGNGTGLQVGGGSGGSVNIHTATLTGTGSIAANGGSGGEAGGGGGRVALYFNSSSGFNIALATATGGSSDGGNPGAVGTVYIPSPAVATNSTLGLSAATLALGQTETLTVTIAGGMGTPALTGTVSFFDVTANSSLGVVALSPTVTGGTALLAVNTLTLGTHVLNASYSGDSNYLASTARNQTVVVTTRAQTITFAPIPNHIFGDAPFTLNATASSGLAVSYAVTSGPATILGNAVTINGAGTVAIQATQAGNTTTYAAATPVTQNFTVAKATQTITFAPIPNHTASDAPFQLSATASSGLTVSYAVASGPATIAGNVVTLTGAGTVQVQSIQAGNANFAAATPVTQTFTVSPSGATLASISPAGGVIGSGATTITLTGANFVSTDTVQLNGAAIPTTFISSTTLTAIIPASFLSATATGLITVFDSAGKSTTAAQSFSVFAAPDINFSGPSTAPSASQPSLTFQLVNPYPFPIAGSLSLTFAPSVTNAVDDPAVQFSAGGRSLLYTIPALSQVTPTVQIQSGTVAGIATVTLVVTSNGVNVTPANVAPVLITIPPAVPLITTATLTRSGTTLTVVVQGFSNTREVSTAKFHFTAASGSSVSTPDLTLPVTSVYADYFSAPVSAPYGSTFVYTQNFTLNDDASSIQNVMVTLVNSVGDSIQVTTP